MRSRPRRPAVEPGGAQPRRPACASYPTQLRTLPAPVEARRNHLRGATSRLRALPLADDRESDGHLPYYLLQRGEGDLYALNMTLSPEEARHYGREGEAVMVAAVLIWTSMSAMENFRQFLSITQGDPNSPFRELIEDMQAGRVDALELSSRHLRDRLRQYQRQGFVAVDPGPTQRVVKIDEFLEGLPG